jgi:amino acid transporter
VWFAAGSVVVLTALNLAGVIFGKVTQNLLTCVKVLGLTAIFLVGMWWGGERSWSAAESPQNMSYGLAMVFVLYAYGGWNDAAFVAAEVRNRGRNMPLALLAGNLGIMLIYLLVNVAYLWGLGIDGVRGSFAPAADMLTKLVGPWGGRVMSLLVMLSALGAINGLIFTGSRIYVSLGKDHRIFAWLGQWSAPRGAPVRSLLVQAVITLLLIAAVGTARGQWLVDQTLVACGLSALPWKQYFGGFETLVAGSAPVFWVFFLLTGVSLFVLRAKDRGITRPFSAPFFPLEPIILCGMCVYMLYSAAVYARGLSLLGIVPLVVGIPLYVVNCLVTKATPARHQDG